MDFATIVYRLQLLGFNSVRLPFSFSDLYDKVPESQVRSCAQVCTHFTHKRWDIFPEQPAFPCHIPAVGRSGLEVTIQENDNMIGHSVGRAKSCYLRNLVLAESRNDRNVPLT